MDRISELWLISNWNHIFTIIQTDVCCQECTSLLLMWRRTLTVLIHTASHISQAFRVSKVILYTVTKTFQTFHDMLGLYWVWMLPFIGAHPAPPAPLFSPLFFADVPLTGPMDLPLSLLEMGCSGRFELITHPVPGQSLPPQSTVSKIHLLQCFFFSLTVGVDSQFELVNVRGKYESESIKMYLLIKWEAYYLNLITMITFYAHQVVFFHSNFSCRALYCLILIHISFVLFILN